jgi:hypothetical protein
MNKNLNQFRDTLPPDEVLLEPSGQFGQDLCNFRDAVHRAAERQISEPAPFGWLNAAKRRRRAAQSRLALAWTFAAALLVAGALPLLHHSRTAVPAVTIKDDTAFLEQVDTAVSESVPSSLAPLEALDDGALDNLDATTSVKSQPTLNKSEKKNVSQ